MEAQAPALLCVCPSTKAGDEKSYSDLRWKQQEGAQQPLQLAVPGVIKQPGWEERMFPPGCPFCAALLVPRLASLSARGSAGLRMQECAACSLFPKVI